MPMPTGMVSFLFTDVVGSSSRWDAAPDAMGPAIRRHDDLLEAAIAARSGHLVKKMGDGCMAVFTDPADAVAAAVTGQSALRAETWDEAIGGLDVRMGVHTGPADLIDGDYHGSTVNRAARLEAAGHGGQITVSAATRVLIADRLDDVSFRDLGEHGLRGMARPERVYQVEAPGLPTDFPPLRTGSTPTNLPARVKSVIGRDDDAGALVDQITESRLVTVVGAGGAGKTTLAIETARRLADRHPAGVWFVELAGLSDGRRVAHEILAAVRRPLPPGEDPAEVLVAALEGQRMLLVLDNCEHLRTEVARLVALLVRAVAEPRILATSREPLGVGGEVVWRIPSLSLPHDRSRSSVAESGAGSMFADAAAATSAGFAITEDNAAAVHDLCHRLDGLPLALELAAARVRSMTVDELNSRLSDSFGLLRSRTIDEVPHHRTLHDTIAWSYDLLSDRERRLARRLSVFAGGFDLAAAEAVGADDDVIDLLDHLVAQSFVQHDDGRYRMLETIRQFGDTLLSDHDESRSARDAHLAWLADLARTGGRQLEGPDQLTWIRRFNAEIDNIRAAFSWALESDPVTGATAATSLTRFFWMNAVETDATRAGGSRSFLEEGYEWSTALLDAAGDDLPRKTRARLQSGVGGMLCPRAGRFEEALVRLEEAQEIFSSLGDRRGLGWARFYDGVAGWGQRSIEESISLFRSAKDLHEEAGDAAGVVTSMLLLAASLGLAGEFTEGRSHLDHFDQIARQTRIPNALAHADDFVASFDAWENVRSDETTRRAAESLERFRASNNYACITHALGGAAMVLARRGHLSDAGRVVGLSDGIRARLNMVLPPYEDRSRMVADVVLDALGVDVLDTAPEEWRAAVTEGSLMDPDEGIDWTVRRLGHEPDMLL